MTTASATASIADCRMISTGIRREWIGHNFIRYALLCGGEFRAIKGEYIVEILWVPESEWPGLRIEYLAYERSADYWWRLLGNQAVVVDLPDWQMVAEAEAW